MSRLGRTVLATAAIGAAGVGYALWEATQFRLRRTSVAVLPAGQPDLRLLHLSDLHLIPSQETKRQWVMSLAEVRPDAVVVTGDFLSHADAIPLVIDAFSRFEGVPAMFVLGSNDYFAPKPLNPAKYLRGPSQMEPARPMLPWTELVDGLTGIGWTHLGNQRARISVDGREIAVRGVDDPHISRDDYAQVAGPFEDADLALGVTHAPYLRVLDAMAADGADLIMAGHTHGGQLRVPGIGALVTNCDLDRSRARGLSGHHAVDPETGHTKQSALHVSAGLGTSPYAPIRFACPPEATLLTLTSRSN
jgi:uncharacterized protein